MKNTVGQIPTGTDFYPRNQVINKIYRRLDTRSHLFMAAPRRVGKSAIMTFLKDNPRENYCFILAIVEAANSTEEFYRMVIEEIIKSKAVGLLIKGKDGLREYFKDISAKVSFFGVDIEIDADGKTTSFQEEFENLLKKLGDLKEQIVIMLDEFPQAIENIKTHQNETIAINFLQQNRRHRQAASKNVLFIYTGSIGLPMVVKKLTSTNVINDLNIVEVPPLSRDEAADMMTKILTHYAIPISNEAIQLTLNKIEWFIPFHIQLIIQELIDVYETDEKPIDELAIEKAFDQLLKRRNNIYFNQYYERLESAFHGSEYDFVTMVLCEIAKQNELTDRKINNIAKRAKITETYESLIDSLIFDGYIHETSKNYRFNSSILKLWWRKNVKC
jgi:hypothetical protein